MPSFQVLGCIVLANHYTYLYTCPVRNEPIYVGVGKDGRCRHHLVRKDMHPLTQRIQWLRKQGKEPVISFICENVDRELALLVEMEAISKWGRKDLGKGPLLNLTDGGEGCKAPNAEARKRQGFHKKHTEETKRVISQKALAQFATQEARAAMSELVKTKMTDEVKVRISSSTKAAMADPERQARVRAGLIASAARPEVKAKQRAARATPEYKAKCAATWAAKKLHKESR